MSGRTGIKADSARQLHFDDNRLLVALFGEHDKNLAQIENRLGVALISRGNRLAVTGADGEVEIACKALGQLYNCLLYTSDAADE